MGLTDNQREKLVQEARSWWGTRYAGHSAVKGKRGGVDCAQLIRQVFINCGFQPDDGVPLRPDYSLQISQHRADTEYIDVVERYMREIPESEVKPGDVVVYHLQSAYSFSHSGLIVSWPDEVVHANALDGVVSVHGTKEPMLRMSKKKFYTLRDENCGDKS